MEQLQPRRGRTERGSSVVEYVLLVGLIAIACLLALNLLGEAGSDRFSTAASLVSTS